MNRLGFTYFNEVPQITKPTVAELLASLTSGEKVSILDGFVKKVIPKTLSYRIGINRNVIRHLYLAIDAIEERARVLMRGEVLITSAEYDEEGVEISPAVYNTPPSTSTVLKNQIKDDFSNDFTESQIIAILTKMTKYSKWDGSGDWTFYKNNVIL